MSNCRWQNDARAEAAIAKASLIAHFRQGMEAAVANNEEDWRRQQRSECEVSNSHQGATQSFCDADIIGFAGYYTAMANGRGIRVKFQSQGADGKEVIENVHHQKALVVLTPTGALRSATAHGTRL